MRVVLEQVLTGAEVARVRGMISGRRFVDGRATSDVAGKRNLQLSLEDPMAHEATEFIAQRLSTHETFRRNLYPAAITQPIFSRYHPGMVYPEHVDAAMMHRARADVSITLFLSGPEDYEGGELELETGNGKQSYRLPAGDAIAYPSTMLHRVAPVTRGLREAAVTWLQSMVRDPLRREILAELGEVARALPAGPYGDRVRRSHANLERMWLDP
jgi:PKHD-type hydroxylase